MCASSIPVESRASTSMLSSLAAISSTLAGSATPSINIMATRVLLFLPILLSTSFSLGEQMRRRTREVLMRRVSTKESLPPFRDFSNVGSDMERTLEVRTSKHSASLRESNTMAQWPWVRSLTASSISVRRLGE